VRNFHPPDASERIAKAHPRQFSDFERLRKGNVVELILNGRWNRHHLNFKKDAVASLWRFLKVQRIITEAMGVKSLFRYGILEKTI
jgi:hypothetical protein